MPGDLKESYAIKKPYSSPLAKAILDIVIALRNQNSVEEALTQILVLLETCPRDIQKRFNKDISKLQKMLLVDPLQVSGATRFLREENALRNFKRIGFTQRLYCHDLWRRVVGVMDEKKWLEAPFVMGANPTPTHIGETVFAKAKE
jgi:hypothetical protein